jgi:hypothetical protein
VTRPKNNPTPKWKHIPIGTRFGAWVVTGNGYQDKSHTRVPCLCDCGTKRAPLRDELLIGRSRSCGCRKWRVPATGERFGTWVVCGSSTRTGKNATRVLCRCDCGTEAFVAVHSLRSGDSKSCGCQWKERLARAHTKHGHARGHAMSVEYHTWHGMKSRCQNPNGSGYVRYGGRGIAVCERWCGEHGFENFLADMGPRPSPRHSLDRINNNGPYSPENCRWATQREQVRNTSANRILTAFDQSKCLTAWAEEARMSPDVLRGRLKMGWSLEQAISLAVARTRAERAKLAQLRRRMVVMKDGASA